MRKIPIKLFEWVNEKSSVLKSLNFEFPLNQTKTLGDIKDFIKEESIKEYKPLCPCFLGIFGQNDEDKKNNILSQDPNYKDNTSLDDTIFNEANEVWVNIPKVRKCTCGNINIYRERAFNLQKNELEKKEAEDKHKKELENQDIKHKKELENLEKNLREDMDKQRGEFRNFAFKQNEKIKEMSNQLFNITNKTKKENERKRKANRRFFDENANVIKEFYDNNSEKIILDLVNEIKNYIQEKISFKDFDISKIIENEKFFENVQKYLQNNLTRIKNDEIISQISHFNILIMGETGAGKSTLLNKVLKANLAKTYFGNICTREIQSYESNFARGLRIYDTRGIETGKYNLFKVFEDIKNKIQNLINENNPDEFIHCIWYCIKSGPRFTDETFENICQCYDIYKIQKLPIIIIFTQADNKIESDQIMEFANKRLYSISDNNYRSSIKIMKVLAKDKPINDNIIIKAYGIYNLIEETCQSAKDGIKSSLYEFLMEKGISMINEEFQYILENLKEDLFKNNLDDAPVDEENIDIGPKFMFDDYDDYDDYDNFGYNTNNILTIGNNNIYNTNYDDKIKLYSNNHILNKNKSLNILNIKFSPIKFLKHVKEFCEKIAVNLTKLEYSFDAKAYNLKSFGELFNYIEQKIKEINFCFEKNFQDNLEKMTEKLANKLFELVTNIDIQTGSNKYLSGEYDYFRLKNIAKDNIKEYLMPAIESKVYENISEILFEKFSYDFNYKLIEHITLFIGKNKSIRNLILKKVKENTDICYNKIKQNLFYEKDDYQVVDLNSNIFINNEHKNINQKNLEIDNHNNKKKNEPKKKVDNKDMKEIIGKNKNLDFDEDE